MMRMSAEEEGVGGHDGGGDGGGVGDSDDKETHIGTWDSKDLDDFANATTEKFPLVSQKLG